MNQRRKRRYYLEDLPLDETYARFFGALQQASALRPTPSEAVPLDQALGRVTAAPVWALRSSPHYHAAAMDGVAVRAEDTVGATETSPVRLRHETQFHWVDTGDPVPPGFNAVVMAEVVHEEDASTIELQAPVAPWQHVRPLGEDIVATELVLPENHRLRPVDLGAIAACGLTQVEVRRRPRVAIIPTGNELVQPGAPLKPGDVVEYNSLTLAAMVQEWGGTPTRFPPTPDDFDRLRAVVEQALAEHDVVIVNAGSSAGSEDFTAPVVESLGRVLVHGVAIRPGHPVVLGVAAGKPVVGIPGYPVSAILTCELFVKPLLERMLGAAQPKRPVVRATMTRKVLSPMGEDEYLRVKLGKVDERTVATPLQRGAGVIMSLVRADGLVRIPRFSEGVHAGATVDVELLRSPEEVERTIVAIGSHDLALDVLASHLRRQDATLTLSSSNVGSMGGLLALKRGEAHLAGCHLLDEDTGEYNVPAVRRVLEGRRVVLVHLVGRVQGLIVAKGNPKRVASLEDLARADVAFINRQRGSGTRVLLDEKLKQIGLAPERIHGYEREEYTHLAVAAAVTSGTADAGLGILAAARALELDFVPLLQEQYDLVIPREHYESALLAPLLAAIRSEAFRRDVAALGGYDVTRMGQVSAEVG
ncbi:MAG: molybdopterin biosynthesis protein [Dehalococcoidia bacterium]|nr:molybdopterin biosynthesis protein [Dehalococcoidia bacterium]